VERGTFEEQSTVLLGNERTNGEGKWRKPSLMEQAAEDVVTPACSAKVEWGLFLPRTDSGPVLPPTPKTNKETKKKQLM